MVRLERRKLKPLALKTRAIRLRSLIADGLILGFSLSVIGGFEKDLSEVKKEMNDDQARRKIFRERFNPLISSHRKGSLTI